MMQFMLCFGLVLMSACSSKEKEVNTIIWYVANDEVWIPHEQEPYTSIKDARIDAVNAYLKELKKPYQVDVHVYPVQFDNLKNQQKAFEEVKKHDAHADILDYQNYWHDAFICLDSYMDTPLGKQVRKEIPEHTYTANLFQGKAYKVVSPKYPIQQSDILIEKKYYQNHKQEIDAVCGDTMKLLAYWNTHYKQKDEYLLTDDFSSRIEDFMFEKYQKIPNTPFYVRRLDKKVINPYEEPAFLKLYNLLSEMSMKGYSGKHMDEGKREDLISKDAILFKYHTSYKPKEMIMYAPQRMNDSYVELAGELKIPYVTHGFGILKDSKHKDEAFDLLASMQTDATLSNLLIYGDKPQMKDGKVEDGDLHATSDYFGTMGNNLLAYPSVNENAKKKELVFALDKEATMKQFVNTNVMLDDMLTKIDEFNKIINEAHIFVYMDDYFDNYQLTSTKEVMQRVDKLKKQLQDAGAAKVIAQLQQQLEHEG